MFADVSRIKSNQRQDNTRLLSTQKYIKYIKSISYLYTVSIISDLGPQKPVIWVFFIIEMYASSES